MRRPEPSSGVDKDRVDAVARVADPGGQAIAGQRVWHRRGFADHEPVGAADAGRHVGLKGRALDFEGGLRVEQNPLVRCLSTGNDKGGAPGRR